MTRPEPSTFGLAAIAAAQAISLDLLRAEMAALAMLLPGQTDDAGPEARDAREAAHAAAFEAGFDDMPV